MRGRLLINTAWKFVSLIELLKFLWHIFRLSLILNHLSFDRKMFLYIVFVQCQSETIFIQRICSWDSVPWPQYWRTASVNTFIRVQAHRVQCRFIMYIVWHIYITWLRMADYLQISGSPQLYVSVGLCFSQLGLNETLLLLINTNVTVTIISLLIIIDIIAIFVTRDIELIYLSVTEYYNIIKFYCC